MPVSTKDGDTPIHEIEIGDYVLAWNEETGETDWYKVTDTIHHTDEVVTEVILDGEWIETTPEHPFYIEEEGWTNAEDLRMGDKVRQADGTTGTVWLRWNVETSQEMYNLTVDEAHTFFVGDGQWLVHNCPPIGGGQNTFLRTYIYSDSTFHTIPSAKTPLKLGYDENLLMYRNTIPGFDYNYDILSTKGLVSLETLQKHMMYANRGVKHTWRIQILEAMKNTDTINFIVDGMDIFKNPERFSPTIFHHTHWEMNQVLQRGYVNKLHLWEGGAEILDQSRLDWILEWKLIRGLR